MELVEVVGGEQWAEMFVHICLSKAHSSAAELSMPKSTGDAGQFYGCAGKSRLEFGSVCGK